ncbi:MAG TPA: squalene synthase HpnC [Blastocatellia bacterium]|nr:squalene synthase HpnC [Blastocatellia bacterium]
MSAPPITFEESLATPAEIKDAFAFCEQMARTHYENFPVGSLLIPKDLRKHVYSIYAFARTADDFADEGYGTATTRDERLHLLDEWEFQLESCYRGIASHPIFIALAETVRALQLPIELFRDLLSAFRQDVVQARYGDFEAVLDYCRRSANPIGRLILLLFGYRDEHLHHLSDYICTALQLANFWQDVAVDLEKDRVYLPAEDLWRFDYGEEELFAREYNERYAALLKFQVDRTWQLFGYGKPLPKLVRGRLSWELSLTWHGGTRILELIERNGYDTLSKRPKITKWDKIVLLTRAIVKW